MPRFTSRRRIWRHHALVVVLVASGCGNRYPFVVSHARHPEYYAGGVDQPHTGSERQRRPPAAAAKPAPKRARPAGERVPPQLADLPGAFVEVAPAAGDGSVGHLDLAGLRSSGAAMIEVNDPTFQDRLDALFDGDTSTLSRTEDVNPLVLRIVLDPPVRLVGARIFPSYSITDWTFRADPGQPRLLVRGAGEELWSRIDLPEPVETGEVQLEIARLVRDHHVHVNEIELLVAP